MLIIKRKQAVVASAAVLIAVAGYLNWNYNTKPNASEEEITANKPLGSVQLVSNDESETDFMTEAKIDRESSRSKSIETLKEIADDKESSEQTKDEAQREVINLTKMTEDENALESLIRAKGFEDAVIYISDGKITAIIKGKKLTGQDVAKIADVISEYTGIGHENIKVIESSGL